MSRIYSSMTILILIFSMQCTRVPTQPSDGKASLAFKVNYVSESEPGILGKNRLSNQEGSVNSMAKIRANQEIDLVRVLILDLSEFDSLQVLLDSDDYHDYKHVRDSWEGDLTNWSEWEKLLGDYFKIIVNQNLTIESDSAKGSLTGVIGLNYFVIAMLKDGKVRYWGEGPVEGKEDHTEQVTINVYKWGNWEE